MYTYLYTCQNETSLLTFYAAGPSCHGRVDRDRRHAPHRARRTAGKGARFRVRLNGAEVDSMFELWCPLERVIGRSACSEVVDLRRWKTCVAVT